MNSSAYNEEMVRDSENKVITRNSKKILKLLLGENVSIKQAIK